MPPSRKTTPIKKPKEISKEKAPPSRRKVTPSQITKVQEIGRQLLNRILQMIVVTLTATIVYVIIFPLSATYLFNLFGVEQNFPIFPAFSSSIDYYAGWGFLLFLLIHIAVLRIFFVRDNDIYLIGFVAFVLSFGIMIVTNFLIFPILVFIYGTTSFTTPILVGDATFTQPLPQAEIFGVSISNLNLFGFIFLYSGFFIFFSLTLYKKRHTNGVSNNRSK